MLKFLPRVWEEGERVEMRFDVARRPGVPVVVPGPAHPGRLFQDDILDAHLLQSDRGADAGNARTDNDGAEVLGTWQRQVCSVYSTGLLKETI